MASEIQTVTQAVKVTEVEAIVVTEVAVDAVTGKQMRAIKIYGAPEGLNGNPVYVLTVTADEIAKVQIKTPTIAF